MNREQSQLDHERTQVWEQKSTHKTQIELLDQIKQAKILSDERLTKIKYLEEVVKDRDEQLNL